VARPAAAALTPRRDDSRQRLACDGRARALPVAGADLSVDPAAAAGVCACALPVAGADLSVDRAAAAGVCACALPVAAIRFITRQYASLAAAGAADAIIALVPSA
jgi:hypothetical protein